MISCSKLRVWISAPKLAASVLAVSRSMAELMVIIRRRSSSDLRASLTRISRRSARSFTVMPSEKVIVRVIGTGATGACGACGRCIESRRCVVRGPEGRCCGRNPGRMPGMPGRGGYPVAGRTGCDGSGRGPPSIAADVPLDGRGRIRRPRAGGTGRAREIARGRLQRLRRRRHDARRLRHELSSRLQRGRRRRRLAWFFDAQPDAGRHEAARGLLFGHGGRFDGDGRHGRGGRRRDRPARAARRRAPGLPLRARRAAPARAAALRPPARAAPRSRRARRDALPRARAAPRRAHAARRSPRPAPPGEPRRAWPS